MSTKAWNSTLRYFAQECYKRMVYRGVVTPVVYKTVEGVELTCQWVPSTEEWKASIECTWVEEDGLHRKYITCAKSWI